MDISVELQNVTKRFGEIKAVDRMNLQIRRGEFFSLLGPSGCGKTTTLRLVAGFETPSEGSILINAADVRGLRPYERNVNTVFQNYALFPHLTVAGNIRFGLERKRTPREKIAGLVDEALELVRLGGLAERYPRQLSGGQQQRVALARALILRPEVLLLDEPLGALDLKLRREMQLELKSLQEKVGITFVYVTHDQEEALTMSERIGVMERGRLEQVGTPEEIYELPRTRFVADFIGLSNFFEGRVTAVSDGELRVQTSGGLDLRLSPDPGRRPGEQVRFSVRPEKLRLQCDPAPPGAWNRLAGRVSARLYLGDSIHYLIGLSERETVTAILKNEGSAARHRPELAVGDQALVSWHRDDSVLLRDEDP